MKLFALILLSCALHAADEKKAQKQNTYDVSIHNGNFNNSADEEWVWRFVPGAGWRKFSPLGDDYKEYKDVKRVTKHKYWW